MTDPRWHGFDRIGSLLALSPSHIDKYLRAAEIALARAFPETEVPPAKMRFDAVHLATSNLGHEPRQQARAKLEQAGVADKVRVAVWPGGSKPARRGWWDSRLNRPGVYRCRIQLSGLQPPGGRAPHLSIAGFDADVVTAEDEPVVVEFERFLSPGDVDFKNAVAGRFPEGHTNNVLDAPDNFFISSRDRRFLNPSGYKLTDDEGRAIRPLLLVDWIEWEGPLTTDEDRRRRAGLWPADPENPDDVQACLVRFAERAWRRPVAVDELAAFAAIVADERAAGEPFRAAYLSALAAILVSNEFLYLQQGSPTEQRSRLDDIELASRLSYFLWSSLPGKLGDTERNTISVDQLIAAKTAPLTRFTSLELSNQGASLAWNGDGIQLPAQGNPGVAFREMFQEPAGGAEGQGPAVPEAGVKQDRHSLSHHNGNPTLMADLTTSDTFNVQQLAYLLGRLAEVRDAEGQLLDSSDPQGGEAWLRLVEPILPPAEQGAGRLAENRLLGRDPAGGAAAGPRWRADRGDLFGRPGHAALEGPREPRLGDRRRRRLAVRSRPEEVGAANMVSGGPRRVLQPHLASRLEEQAVSLPRSLARCRESGGGRGPPSRKT